MLAEAGKDERVTPLNAQGLSKGEELMLELLQQRNDRSPAQITINPPPNMDVETLARLVVRDLGFQMGKQKR
jgi:hypothetical protein